MATGLIESVYFELNQCRSNPSKYSSKLSNTLKYYKGKIFEKPGYPSVETEEGPENIQACIKYLKSVRPAAPLEWSEVLAKAAQAHVDDLGPKGLMGHDSSKGLDASARVQKYGQWSGQLGENIDYGNCEGEDIVVSLLIDDGVLARGQRLNIMKREHVYVGIGFGYHAEYEYMCVIIFAEVIVEIPSNPLKIDSSPLKEPRFVPNPASSPRYVKNMNKSAYETFDINSYERDELSLDEIVEIKQIFDNIDYENFGAIDMTSLKAALESQDLNISDNSVLKLLNDISLDHIGKIDFDEFLDLISEQASSDSSVQLSPKKPPNPGARQKNEVKKSEGSDKKFKKTEVEEKPTIQTKLTEEVKTQNPLPKVSEYSNLTKNDISQIKDVFDAYDSEGLGYIDLEDLIQSINSNNYEAGTVEIIDVLLTLNDIKRHKVGFNQLLGLLNKKLSSTKETAPVYTKTEVKTTTTYIDGQKYKKTIRKTVLKPNKIGTPFDPSLYERPGITEDQIIEIKDAFDLFGLDKSGKIETRDLKNAMKSQGFEEKSPIIYKMICELDMEGKGKVDFDEFLDMMTEKNVDESSKEEIKKLFNLFDVDNSGFIELRNLKKIARELGESLSEEEIRDLIIRSDSDGDGKVSFQEFYDIMSRNTS
jgi:centrin-1